eukprot:440266-Pleurochrysis_carterae.AAC.1
MMLMKSATMVNYKYDYGCMHYFVILPTVRTSSSLQDSNSCELEEYLLSATRAAIQGYRNLASITPCEVSLVRYGSCAHKDK